MTDEQDTERSDSDDSADAPRASSKPIPSLEQKLDQILFRRHAPVDDDEEDTGPAVKLTPLQTKEHQFRDNPLNTQLAFELTDLYLAEGRAYDAERVLKTVAEMTDNDEAVCNRLDEVRIFRSMQKVESAKKLAEVERTPSAREKVKQAHEAHVRLELQILQARVERSPDDKKYQYELGVRLKTAGKRDEAIACFESVCADPHLKAPATLKIGECHQLETDFLPALESYRHAIDAAAETGQTECQKLALYRAGVLASAMKMIPAAKRYLQDLLKLDGQFKDAAKRLEVLNQLGG